MGKVNDMVFLEIEIVKDHQNESRHLQNHVLINLTGLCQAIAAPAEERVYRVRLVTNVYPKSEDLCYIVASQFQAQRPSAVPGRI